MMRDANDLPLVFEVQPAPRAEDVFVRLASRPHCLFLDSALRHAELGRWSFVAADPFDFIRRPADGGDALAELAARMESFSATVASGGPPFQGGAAGLWSYELGRGIENVPPPASDEFSVPAMAVGLYDVVVAFDHGQNRAWIVSQGLPETEPQLRRRRARQRLEQFQSWLQKGPTRDAPAADVAPLDRSQLARQFDVGDTIGLTSNFSREAYLRAVERVVEYILAGDVFQVNLSQRLLYPQHVDSIELYRGLRRCNPAPFAGYFDLGDFRICSTSPERFLRVQGAEVEARPIKGTRARTARPEADLFAGDDLKQSEKDRAENVMIVDLMRNDLSRVCRPESVRVTQFCGLEHYAYVQHLVSVIRGTLAEGFGPIDLLRACFPGGSITGAPKVRAMEIIAELEPTARGAYCGSLGYLGFDGTMDTSILIRTITAGRGWLQIPVGGGIVAQSDPRVEYEETWHKAEGMLRALKGTDAGVRA